LPNHFDESCRAVLNGGNFEPIDTRLLLEELQRTYAMAEERSAHTGYSGRAAQTQDDEITFF
jgi:methyl-accepting chemotaxis protein